MTPDPMDRGADALLTAAHLYRAGFRYQPAVGWWIDHVTPIPHSGGCLSLCAIPSGLFAWLVVVGGESEAEVETLGEFRKYLTGCGVEKWL